MTKAQGIAKAVKHMRSAAYQHELHLPTAGWENTIDDFLHQRINEVYEQCGITQFGFQPELMEMYRYGHIKVESPR